jgi:hypothetical protein
MSPRIFACTVWPWVCGNRAVSCKAGHVLASQHPDRMFAAALQATPSYMWQRNTWLQTA